jgi:phosphatidylglycerol lysyltransferase
LTKGVDYEEASLSVALLGVLYLARREFTVRSGLPDFRLAAVRATIAFALLFLYGVGGFWLLEEVQFNFNFHVADAVRATLAVITLAGDPDLTAQTAYAVWFARSVYLLTFVAMAYTGFALFLPVVYRFRTLPRERARAAALLERYGRSSIDYFKLWPDKAYYFSPTGNSFIAYAVGGHTAVALGDPVGSDDEVETTIQGFAKLCRVNDWRIAFHQTLPDFIAVYQKLGFRKLKIGDEASIDLTTFNLEGKERKKLRAVVNRFAREGVRLEQFPPPVPATVLRQAREVSDDWLRLPGRRERTFSVGLFDETYLRQTPVVAMFNSDGEMLAFVNRIPAYVKGEATIDLMRHRTDAPNGTMDFLFTKLFLMCRQEGYKQFSLGLAPLARFGDSEPRTAEERAVHFFLNHLNFLFSYAGLRQYKAKFASSWEPRYLIYRHAHELPRIAYALTRVGELHQGENGGSRGIGARATRRLALESSDEKRTMKPALEHLFRSALRRASSRRVRYVALIAVLFGALIAGYLFSRIYSRPLPPQGRNALVLRAQLQDIYFYPAANNDRNAPKVLLLCGDGGWERLAPNIAAEMARDGYDVYGFDTKRYLESFTTDAGTLSQQDVVNDLREVAHWMQTRWRERITLAGLSEGAGLAGLAASAPDRVDYYDGVILAGLTDRAELGWRLRDDTTYITGGDPDEPSFGVVTLMPQVTPLPLTVISATNDEFTSPEVGGRLFAAARDPKQSLSVEANNHNFGGNEQGFFQNLRGALQWTQAHAP